MLFRSSKSALDAVVARWGAESSWAQRVTIAHALIGWTKGTGLMGHNDAIVDAVEEALLPLGAKPVRREGRASGRWVLIDFGDIVLQAFHEEDREFYDLERLWQDCPVIELDLDEAAS